MDPGAAGEAEVARLRALIFDDDDAFGAQCASLLKEEGFESEHTRSPNAALERLAHDGFELVVWNPGLGTASQRVLQAADESAHRPAILVVTSLEQNDRALEALKAAGRTILFKPIDPVELGRSIAWVLHERQLARGNIPHSQLEALYRMARAANSEPSLPALLDRVLGLCIEAFGAVSGSIMIASTGQPRTLSIAASYGLARRSSDPVPFGSGVAGWVAQHRRPIRLVGSLEAYPQFAGLRSNASVADAMVAPIVFRKEVLGTISVNAARSHTFAPESLAVLVSAADIVAAAVHRDRLERAREHQDRLAMLGQLSASLAHELNNPVAYLKSNIAVLGELAGDENFEGLSPPELRAELSEIARDLAEGMDRIFSLVTNLRSAARKSSAEIKPFDVNTVLRRAQILVHPQFKHRLKLMVEEGNPPQVVGDAGRVLQVVVNLLVNASQAIPKDGQVTLRSRAEEGRAVIEVEDNGPGIPDEVAQHLFEPFFTTKPDGEGTGLGLSISRQIAREHGGDLSFRSQVGRGTCFTLWLPAAGLARVERPVVLVVEDEPALLVAMTRVLEDSFEVLSAKDAEEATALATGRKLDLILADFALPKEDGVSLIRALRSRGERAPAALVTAVDEHPEIEEALASGLVVRRVTKPWTPTSLLAEARRLLEETKP